MKPFDPNDDGSVTVFMCATSWQHEIGQASGGERVYPSLEDMKERCTCWDTCGVVQLKVFFEKVVVDPPKERL